ncbi:YdcF family protein [Streptococcus ovuberis]|uniref:YdcF family protein n=2 Tax=Streptococcus ovuberis TaxID=1936207 RepID=A0A7X6S0X4_9STRE|nr:YdcF family protein [Streptococcus ovuberis]NKZ20643.1 YdcF family protein [Streptococcus ovuberis]
MILGLTALSWLIFFLIYHLERRQVLLGFVFLVSSALSIVTVVSQVNASVETSRLLYGLVLILGLFLVLGAALGPLLLIMMLLLNGVKLLRREGVKWDNFLSLGLALSLFIYLYFFPRLASQFTSFSLFYYLYLLVGLIITYVLILSFAYTLAAILNAYHPPHRGKLRYLVVLGAGLMGDQVTPLLASRIDKAIAIYRKRPGCKLIMSGGQGPDELVAEAKAMADYAIEQGVPESDILLEDQSKNTQENIRFSVQLMPEGSRFAVVTNYYHLFRALNFARLEGVPCIGYGAKTKFYFSLNAFIREFIGYLVISRKIHLVLFGILGVLYTMLVIALRR